MSDRRVQPPMRVLHQAVGQTGGQHAGQIVEPQPAPADLQPLVNFAIRGQQLIGGFGVIDDLADDKPPRLTQQRLIKLGQCRVDRFLVIRSFAGQCFGQSAADEIFPGGVAGPLHVG